MLLGACLGVPHGVLFEVFWACLGPKKSQKALKGTLWGTPSQEPKSTQKALVGHFPAGPLGTPVNGSRNRKPNTKTSKNRLGLRDVLFQNRKIPQRTFATEISGELSGELSGAICLKTLVLLGRALEHCSENSLVLFVQFFAFGVLFWLPIIYRRVHQDYTHS